MAEVKWMELMGKYDETTQTLAMRALRTQADPDNPLNWGVREGKFVRMVVPGEYEELSVDQVQSGMRHLEFQKNMKPSEKSLTDRAYELLFVWIGCNTRPYRIDDSEADLPREAVRWCRALEAEVAQATKRPEEKLRTARRQAEEEEDLL